MRYYCKNCGSEFKTGFKSDLTDMGTSCVDDDNDELHFYNVCPYCDEKIVKVPDYETPEQYKKRTGKLCPDNMAVWAKCRGPNYDEDCVFRSVVCMRCSITSDWCLTNMEYVSYDKCHAVCVIANPPIPPPDDFTPEVQS